MRDVSARTKPSREGVTAHTSSGVLIGEDVGSSRRWLGIPYALPLTAERRWREAEPINTPEVVRQCTRYGQIAWQPTVKFMPRGPELETGEECLNLNIWAPTNAQEHPLPVMVFVHGGASLIGFSAYPIYNAAELSTAGNVIVVTINYRLGAFGALDFTWLNASSTSAHRFESNLGLKDVVTALRWVRENIAEFGGDPGNVTLFGESAGGAAVTTLMTAPSASGLFHRAIAQSAPATSVYHQPLAAATSSSFLRIAGIDPQSPDAAEKLWSAPADELSEHSMTLVNRMAETMPGTLAFAPVVDGEFLPDHPANVFERGDQMPVPLIIGSNKNEAALFKLIRSPIMPRTQAQVTAMMENLANHTLLGDDGAQEIRDTYFRKHSGSEAMRLSTDAGFRMPALWFASAHSTVAPTFVYRYDFSMPLPKALGFGAMHGAELPYVFGTIPSDKPLLRRRWIWWGSLKRAVQVSQGIRQFWTQFAHAGMPNRERAAEWPHYDDGARQTLIIGNQFKVEEDPDATQRRAWPSRPVLFAEDYR